VKVAASESLLLVAIWRVNTTNMVSGGGPAGYAVCKFVWVSLQVE
jgi:hypothetical protein